MSGPNLPTPDGVPPSGWPGGGGYQRFRPVPSGKEELEMMPSLSRCPVCHESIWNCRCRRGQHDVSFDLWAIDEVKVEKKDTSTEIDKNAILGMWDDVIKALNYNLSIIQQYKNALEKDKEEFIINEAFKDYISSRFEMIEHCMCGFYLNDLLKKEEWSQFNTIQQTMMDYLENSNDDYWKNPMIFNEYLCRMYELNFYKKNCLNIK